MASVHWRWCGLALLLAVSATTAQQGEKPMPVSFDRVTGASDGDVARFRVGNTYVAHYLMRHGSLTRHPIARPIFWPVVAPGGQRLTRDWPFDAASPDGSSDHVHQQSIWFCHGDVIPEGIELKEQIKGVDGVDFWSEAKGHGSIVCTKANSHLQDKNEIRWMLKSHNEWRAADGTKILDEDRDIHVYALGKANLIVLRINLHASVCPVTFGDTKEGALGVRINDVIRAGKFGKGKIENAQGKVGEKECWGHISDWCDYSGPIDGKTVGLTVMADPKNPYPTYWHVRDYGLMAANPFGRKKAGFHDSAADKELVRLAKGAHLELRYGILLHDGNATDGQVAENYKRFVKLREKE
jgi:hypothetical protein